MPNKKPLIHLLEKVRKETRVLGRPIRLMEVCGTHTMAIHRYGLKPQLEAAGVEMISGPGCPVCITPDSLHEAAIELVTQRERTILATFGDMTRVPTRKGSLQTAIPARGSLVKIVYSPEEALDTSRRARDKDVVFFGAGFETTIPGIAFTLRQAYKEKVGNFSVLTAFWLIPPAIRAILESGECAVDGFLYPGHVSVIIGESPYAFIPEKYGLPGAIAGFEPEDILKGVLSVLGQIQAQRPRVANEYSRVVRPEGNPVALDLMKEMLEPWDAYWRGLGTIPQSGLRLKKKFSVLDAVAKYSLEICGPGREARGCRCGEVLRGVVRPTDCRHFGKACTPESPLGPCMVSNEGACLIDHKYSRTLQ
jgi:hydrogenase expression/formation protein HypD